MLETFVIFVAVVLDQLTKLWAQGALTDGAISIIPGIINFRYVENTGAAFSIFDDSTLALTIISSVLFVALCFILVRYRKRTDRYFKVYLACIAGGALGNIIDRVILGYVVDFIEFDFMNFAVFNVADIFVTVGTVLMVIYLIFTKSGRKLISGDKKDGAECGGN